MSEIVAFADPGKKESPIAVMLEMKCAAKATSILVETISFIYEKPDDTIRDDLMDIARKKAYQQ